MSPKAKKKKREKQKSIKGAYLNLKALALQRGPSTKQKENLLNGRKYL